MTSAPNAFSLSMNRVTEEDKRRRILGTLRAWFPHILAITAVTAFLVVSLLLWREWGKRFPSLAAGFYSGTIGGTFPDDAARTVPFYVERKAAGDEALFVVVRQGWQPQPTALIAEGDQNSGSGFVPVILSGPDVKLKLVGRQTGPFAYQGSVLDMHGGNEGSWHLNALQDGVQKSDEQDLQLWLMLHAELANVNELIKQAEDLVPRQREEIERLTSYITEGERLRARSEEKYRAAKDELHAIQQVLMHKQEEAKLLLQKFELSERVTSQGRLVSLVREAMDRETRWFDSMMRSSIDRGDLEEQVARGEKILALKRELTLEKERLQRLERRHDSDEVSDVEDEHPSFGRAP